MVEGGGDSGMGSAGLGESGFTPEGFEVPSSGEAWDVEVSAAITGDFPEATSLSRTACEVEDTSDSKVSILLK